MSSELSAAEKARRRRAAALLGDLAPDVPSDETPAGWNEERDGSRDAQMLRDRPPHHGA